MPIRKMYVLLTRLNIQGKYLPWLKKDMYVSKAWAVKKGKKLCAEYSRLNLEYKLKEVEYNYYR